ncbi:hypothetical protein FB451DRAFT_1283928, partial [Mycena latifolia]
MAAALVRAAVVVVRSAIAGLVVSVGALAVTAAEGDPAGVPVAVVDAEGVSFAGPTGSRKGDDDGSAVAPGWAVDGDVGAEGGALEAFARASSLRASSLAKLRGGVEVIGAEMLSFWASEELMLPPPSILATGTPMRSVTIISSVVCSSRAESGLNELLLRVSGWAAAKARALPLTDEPAMMRFHVLYVLEGVLL